MPIAVTAITPVLQKYGYQVSQIGMMQLALAGSPYKDDVEINALTKAMREKMVPAEMLPVINAMMGVQLPNIQLPEIQLPPLQMPFGLPVRSRGRTLRCLCCAALTLALPRAGHPHVGLPGAAAARAGSAAAGSAAVLSERRPRACSVLCCVVRTMLLTDVLLPLGVCRAWTDGAGCVLRGSLNSPRHAIDSRRSRQASTAAMYRSQIGSRTAAGCASPPPRSSERTSSAASAQRPQASKSA